ncbi:glycosyltransferase [Streptomyces sp. NPDC086787]|uniref:glycosyltransferase n=1 Tax=Streptomyces sp. NPDC086787 TaxID=3365759 RepID=UPI003801E5AB
MNARAVERPEEELLVAVVTHTVPEPILSRVLEALREDGPATHVVVLYTGAPESPAARTLDALCRRLGVDVMPTPRAMRIGEARQFLVERASPYRFVAFLDDDCVPLPGWTAAAHRACADPLPTALYFGPRHPAPTSGVGPMVRALETRTSRKLALAARPGAPDAVVDPKALCAGGNIIVNISAARELGLTGPVFARTAFEDVDFQLRAGRHGWAVQFRSRLQVDHYDELDVPVLLRKSWHSGKGMARCATLHAAAFWERCRWRPWRALASWATVLACLTAAVGYPWAAAGALLPVVLNTCAHVRELRGTPLRDRAAYLLVKPVRDLIIGLGFVTHYAMGRLLSRPSAHRTATRPTPATAPRRGPLDELDRVGTSRTR